MKKTGFVLIAVGLILVGAGCASSGKAAILAPNEPIALVSVVSNEDINWQGESPTNPDTIGALVKRKLRTDPDLTVITKADELINTAETLLREAIGDSRHFTLAEKETVFNSRAYQEAREKKYPNRDMVKADNYRFVDSRDKIFPAALAAETGIKRIMHVEFNFTKFLYSGVSFLGSCRPNVEMTVIILDDARKTLYRKTTKVAGLSSTKSTNGVYSQSELLQNFESTLFDVYFEFLDQFN